MAQFWTEDQCKAALSRCERGIGMKEDGLIVAWLFRQLAERMDDAPDTDRQANALAAVLADLLDGEDIDTVANDLPHGARRRVLAYRHARNQFRGVPARDQFGPLPAVPPRSSVMRGRVRHDVIDGEWWESASAVEIVRAIG